MKILNLLRCLFFKRANFYLLLLCAVLSIHDVCPNNTAAIFGGASHICCRYVAVTNPIVALLGGATIALATVTYNACPFCTSDTSDAIVLAERFYYEQRKSALEKIKYELITIKNGLEAISGFSVASFTYQFLHQHTYGAVKSAHFFSIIQEKDLSDEQKSKLREAREYELAALEKQIQDILVLLALHANQLIDNVWHAYAVYDGETSNIGEAINAWNNNLNAITHEIAVRLYKCDLLQQCLLQNLCQAIDELVLVAEYYRAFKAQSIQETTTILLSFGHIMPVISEKKQLLVQQEPRVHNNIAIAEQYFTNRAISVVALRNVVQKEFADKQKERAAQVLKKVSVELANSSFPGGPKKDDDEDDDKDSGREQRNFKTTKEATEEAEKLGFKKTNYQSSGQPVFKKGNRYISPDRDSHNGGVWKMADSVKNLGSRTTRMGTYDKFLNRIGN